MDKPRVPMQQVLQFSDSVIRQSMRTMKACTPHPTARRSGAPTVPFSNTPTANFHQGLHTVFAVSGVSFSNMQRRAYAANSSGSILSGGHTQKGMTHYLSSKLTVAMGTISTI